MSSSELRSRGTWRRAREFALATCAAWLVVQNAVLLAAFSTMRPDAAWHAAGSVLRAALAVMAPLWLIPLILLAGGAIALAARAVPAARTCEERHG
ncbi:MAG TPA: hypothetical protein VMH61_09025 [Candidatus Acidoferrales bacterium]|nr:hypothetical protein [Candidatus Acidoferrales bacterium]